MTGPPGRLAIPRPILDAMNRHCLDDAPLECCGILGGNGRLVASFYPLRNELASETTYRADGSDLIAAVVALRSSEQEIVALYHSHPAWAPIPSKTDLRDNHYGDVPRIIVSLLGPQPEVRAWRLAADSYDEIPIDVVD